MNRAFDYYADQIVVRGSSFYYSLLAIRPEHRQTATALIWLYKQFNQIVFNQSEPEIAYSRLQWWQQELQRMLHDTPSHPVTLCLQQSLKQLPSLESSFTRLIHAKYTLLEPEPFPTVQDLMRYCNASGGALALIMHSCNGGPPSNAAENSLLSDLGTAIELSNFYKFIGKYARSRFELVPQDWRHEYNIINVDQLRTQALRFFPVMDNMINTIFSAALIRIRRPDTSLRPAFVSASAPLVVVAELTLKLLQEIRKNYQQLLQCRTKVTPLRKYWTTRRVIRQLHSASRSR